eukprot:12988810-Ditylum_brightwellii.AAC.1
MRVADDLATAAGHVKSMVHVHSRDTFKTHTMQHFTNVTWLTPSTKSALPEDDKHQSDTFAKHLANHFPCDATPQQLHKNKNVKVLWQGNFLSHIKAFKTAKY